MATRKVEKNGLDESPRGYVVLLNRVHSRTLEIGDILTIGRGSSNELILSDAFASTRHASIERKPEGFLLKDMRSSNGTFLNGSRIKEAWLQNHDRLLIGECEMVFHTESPSHYQIPNWTSKNMSWALQLKQLPAIAQAEFPVLILGPSGAGKELIARSLHSQSRRRHRPFVSVNCSALTESLVESELFGHLRGSFTGAMTDRKGAFEAARGGTLFLDEVGDLPLELQPKLLRALENREIKPVGSDDSIATDVRVVAATHQNLQRKVKNGDFREDLYFRLNVLHIRTPSLRERIEDLEDLLLGFSKEFRVAFSTLAVENLKKMSWPGNIRELKNMVARAAALYPRSLIDVSHLDSLCERHITYSEKPKSVPKMQQIKTLERQIIQERLLANGGNQRRTAEELGMAKSTLHDRIKSYGLNARSLIVQDGGAED